MKKIIILNILILFGISGIVFGQSVIVSNQRQSLIITFDKPINDIELENKDNYVFYELIDPEGINIKAHKLEDLKANRIVPKLGGKRIILSLSPPKTFEYGKVYLLKINKVKNDGKELPVVRIKLEKNPAVKIFNQPRQKMRLVSNNVELSENDVNVEEKFLGISSDKETLEVKKEEVTLKRVEKDNPFGIDITYKDKLSEGRNHSLKAELRSDDGTPLTAETKIAVPGLPATNPNPDIDMTLSSEFGEKFKPQSNLAGVFRKRFADAKIGKSKQEILTFEPGLSVDVGIGATNSKNAITLDLPTIQYTLDFTRRSGCNIPTLPTLRNPSIEEDDKVEHPKLIDAEETANVELPCYYEWENRGWFDLYSIDFKAGPKFEMDRAFARVNTLGSLRFDFNFDRWQHSIANQQFYLKQDLQNTDYKDSYKDVYIKSGFTLTPRIGLEFGRKVTGEVIENSDRSIRFLNPQYPILRGYFGFTNVFEWNYGFLPIRLSITEDIYYYAYTETAGEIDNNALNLRRIRGFHPYGKATLDFALHPAKHINFSIIYENGRAAPNFEYLNTVKTGIRFVY